LTVQLTKGPYEVTADETDAYNISNITDSQTGLPITYLLTVTKDNATLSGVRLDAWFANAEGLYSGVDSLGTGDQDFLRGWQTTNDSGIATFYGIFPGIYSGRTAHVHIRIRRYDDSGSVIYNNTTQLFFPESIIDEVMKLDAYKTAAASNWDTENDADNMYNTENLMTLTGDTTNGYTATYTIELPLNESSASTSDSDMSSGPTFASGSSSRIALIVFVVAVVVGLGAFAVIRKRKAAQLQKLFEQESTQQSFLMTAIPGKTDKSQ